MKRTPMPKPRLPLFALLLLLSCGLAAGELPGSLAWSDRIAMGTLVSGMVAEVPVQPGQRVKKGDLLVAMDSRGFLAELAGARAEAVRANILLDEAQREDERADELYERTVLSEHERTLAVIGLRKAQANARRAQATLMQARLDHERSQLHAPADGLVLAVHVSPGVAVVNTLKSEPLVELAADGHMLLHSTTDLATARQIEQGRAQVEVAGRRIDAESVEIGFEPLGQDQAGPRYAISVRFERPLDMELRAGEPARVLW